MSLKRGANCPLILDRMSIVFNLAVQVVSVSNLALLNYLFKIKK